MTEKEKDVKAEEEQQVETSTDQEVEAQEQPEATGTSSSDVKGEDVKEPDKLADGEDPEAKTVPYSRFKEVNDRLKELEAKAEERKAVGDDVEDSLLEELFGLKEERQKMAEAAAPKQPQQPPQYDRDAQSTPDRPEESEDDDKPITKRELMEMQKQHQQMAAIEHHRQQFQSNYGEGVEYLAKNYDMSPQEANMLLMGPARQAYIEAGKLPIETAKFFGERFLKQYRNKVLKGYVKGKVADKAKPKQSDSGGGTPHMARKIKSMDDARQSFMERMRIKSEE